MPTLRSPKRGTEPAADTRRPRFVLPVILIVVLAVLTVAVIASLPRWSRDSFRPSSAPKTTPAAFGTGPPGGLRLTAAMPERSNGACILGR